MTVLGDRICTEVIKLKRAHFNPIQQGRSPYKKGQFEDRHRHWENAVGRLELCCYKPRNSQKSVAIFLSASAQSSRDLDTSQKRAVPKPITVCGQSPKTGAAELQTSCLREPTVRWRRQSPIWENPWSDGGGPGLGGSACPPRPLLDGIRTALRALRAQAFVPAAPGFLLWGSPPNPKPGMKSRQGLGQCLGRSLPATWRISA